MICSKETTVLVFRFGRQCLSSVSCSRSRTVGSDFEARLRAAGSSPLATPASSSFACCRAWSGGIAP